MTMEQAPVRIPPKKVRDRLVHEVEDLSGETIMKCYQCGKCTAGCPFTAEMELKPNQVIRLVQLGLIDVLVGDSIWFCATCQLCGARCPKGVDLSKIMDALRQIVLRRNVDRFCPSKLEPEDLKDMPNIALVSAFRKHTG